jgi:hypothetical protein
MSALLPRLLGADFARLPQAVRRVHGGDHTQAFSGRASVARGASPAAMLLGGLARLPPSGEVALAIEFVRADDGETWVRHFAAHRMTSRLWESAGVLHEQLGAARFAFALHVEAGELHWRLLAVRGLGVPLPVAWFAATRSRVFDDDGRYGFDVQAALPAAGSIVRYRGWLDAS